MQKLFEIPFGGDDFPSFLTEDEKEEFLNSSKSFSKPKPVFSSTTSTKVVEEKDQEPSEKRWRGIYFA